MGSVFYILNIACAALSQWKAASQWLVLKHSWLIVIELISTTHSAFLVAPRLCCTGQLQSSTALSQTVGKWPINTEHSSLMPLFLHARSDCRHLQIHLFGHSWEVPSSHFFSKPVLQGELLCSTLPVLWISLTALSGDLVFVVLCLALESTKLLLIYTMTWRQWLQLKKKQSLCRCRDITSIQRGWFRLGNKKNNTGVILWVIVIL